MKIMVRAGASKDHPVMVKLMASFVGLGETAVVVGGEVGAAPSCDALYTTSTLSSYVVPVKLMPSVSSDKVKEMLPSVFVVVS
jgi:hypothetical protein